MGQLLQLISLTMTLSILLCLKDLLSYRAYFCFLWLTFVINFCLVWCLSAKFLFLVRLTYSFCGHCRQTEISGLVCFQWPMWYILSVRPNKMCLYLQWFIWRYSVYLVYFWWFVFERNFYIFVNYRSCMSINIIKVYASYWWMACSFITVIFVYLFSFICAWNCITGQSAQIE